MQFHLNVIISLLLLAEYLETVFNRRKDLLAGLRGGGTEY